MIAAIDDCDRASLFAEIHVAAVALDIKIAIDEQCSSTKCAPERLLPVEVEVAMAIGCSAVQCIIRTFKMAVLIIRMACTVQWVEVETTNEADVFGDETLPMNIAHMGLGNGITAFWPV